MSGAHCPSEDGQPAFVEIEVVTTDSAETQYVGGFADVADDGTWSSTITIPADAPPGLFATDVLCLQSETDGFIYDSATFTVLAPAATLNI